MFLKVGMGQECKKVQKSRLEITGSSEQIVHSLFQVDICTVIGMVTRQEKQKQR
jgi:hypothetical protein